jgi:chitosanase
MAERLTRSEQRYLDKLQMRRQRRGRVIATTLFLAAALSTGADSPQGTAEGFIHPQKPNHTIVDISPLPSPQRSPSPTPDVSPASTSPSLSPKPSASESSKKPETTINRQRFMQLLASAENETLEPQYGYIEDINDGRGWTAGVVGFTSGTGDMLEVLRNYNKNKPNNSLTQYTDTLAIKNNSDPRKGLGNDFATAWKTAAQDPVFRKAQDALTDKLYLTPAKELAKEAGFTDPLAVYCFFDAAVMHGTDEMRTILAKIKAQSPKDGSDKKAFLQAFLNARVTFMQGEPDHKNNIDRVITMQQRFLDANNFGLNPPLTWRVNAKEFNLTA